MAEPSDLPAPLDAYSTAKPGEPTFTLQGGDPLAPLLVQLWVDGARALAGISPKPCGFVDRWIITCENNQVDTESREAENLLRRATAAEEVMWDMVAYQKGLPSAGENPGQNPHGENLSDLDEKARLDLHDLRVRYAQKLSGFASELSDMREELLRRGGFFCGEHDPLDNVWLSAIWQLKEMNRLIEPRRLMQSPPKST
jgi:hypothetical protein